MNKYFRNIRPGFALAEVMVAIAIIALLAAIMLPRVAKAAQVNPFAPQIVTVTNLPAVVTTGAQSNTTSYVSIPRNGGASFTWKYNTSAGTSNAVALLYPTGDGTNYGTSPWLIVDNANTATDRILFTNWSQAQLSGVVGFKIGALTNQNTGTLTNKLMFFTLPVIP